MATAPRATPMAMAASLPAGHSVAIAPALDPPLPLVVYGTGSVCVQLHGGVVGGHIERAAVDKEHGLTIPKKGMIPTPFAF